MWSTLEKCKYNFICIILYFLKILLFFGSSLYICFSSCLRSTKPRPILVASLELLSSLFKIISIILLLVINLGSTPLFTMILPPCRVCIKKRYTAGVIRQHCTNPLILLQDLFEISVAGPVGSLAPNLKRSCAIVI